MFKKYQHIEKYGNDEVEGIEFGLNFIFPKVDGSNSSLWLENDNLCAGSRRRKLSLDADNQGFYEWALRQENIKEFFKKYSNYRIYGEWLVPHTIKTYRDTAWRDMYVFDVCLDIDDERVEYLSYDNYKEKLDEFDIEYIPCMAKIKNPTYETLLKCLNENDYLIEDGKGIGEGIVLKNYDYYNKYGRQIWAKIITSEFKGKHRKAMGATYTDQKKMMEEIIIEDYCTTALIEKTYDKIRNANNGWSSKNIPELLNRVYHDLVEEEIWNIVKKYKNPTINFKTLQYMVNNKIKEVKKDLF